MSMQLPSIPLRHWCSVPMAIARTLPWYLAGNGDHYATVKGSLATASGAKTMALDDATHRIYVPTMSAKALGDLGGSAKNSR